MLERKKASAFSQTINGGVTQLSDELATSVNNLSTDVSALKGYVATKKSYRQDSVYGGVSFTLDVQKPTLPGNFFWFPTLVMIYCKGGLSGAFGTISVTSPSIKEALYSNLSFQESVMEFYSLSNLITSKFVNEVESVNVNISSSNTNDAELDVYVIYKEIKAV